MELTNTCQICGRNIKAKKGTIALHGYRRPGHGWQTASCFGAGYLPYEVSRDRIQPAIESLKAYRDGQNDAAAEMLANPPATLSRRASYRGAPEKQATRPEGNVTAELSPYYGTYEILVDGKRSFGEYARIAASAYHGHVSAAKIATADLGILQARYDGWVQVRSSEVKVKAVKVVDPKRAAAAAKAKQTRRENLTLEHLESEIESLHSWALSDDHVEGESLYSIDHLHERGLKLYESKGFESYESAEKEEALARRRHEARRETVRLAAAARARR